jgi:hypothetical protein
MTEQSQELHLYRVDLKLESWLTRWVLAGNNQDAEKAARVLNNTVELGEYIDAGTEYTHELTREDDECGPDDPRDVELASDLVEDYDNDLDGKKYGPLPEIKEEKEERGE